MNKQQNLVSIDDAELDQVSGGEGFLSPSFSLIDLGGLLGGLQNINLLGTTSTTSTTTTTNPGGLLGGHLIPGIL